MNPQIPDIRGMKAPPRHQDVAYTDVNPDLAAELIGADQSIDLTP